MTKQKAALTAGAVLAAVYLWSATASAIYCLGTGKIEMFNPPFLQWWQVLPYWNANWWVTTWVVAGGAIPTLAAMVGAYRVLRARFQGQQLYGRTEWPTREQIQSGGFSLRKRL